jgi:hypothetical protein
MITYVLPNIGLNLKMQCIADQINSGAIQAHLYQSTPVLSDTTSLANLTEATFAGYSAASAAAAVVPGGPANATATITSASVTFTNTGTVAQTLGGVYWAGRDQATVVTDLLCVATLPGGAAVVSQPGDSILASLTLTDTRATGQP